MKRLYAALGFLTVMPLPAVCRHTERDLAGSVAFFPLIGFLIGLSAAGAQLALEDVFPPLVLAMLLIGWLAMMHGGLHLDGLADTADGFLSHHGRERVLEIMRDSHIGAFGCLAMGGVLALKVAALASLPNEYWVQAILFAPLAGRSLMVPMLNLLPPARADGLGNLFTYRKNIKDSGRSSAQTKAPPLSALARSANIFHGEKTIRGLLESMGAMAVLLAVAWFTLGFAGLFATAVVVASMLLFVYWCQRRIGGITGDTLGAANEIAEMLVLLTLCTQW
uniref:Adenosylcobinamide-GDP ribazoletransferase n=1 Tax=Candidatus Kentrum sp. UNK TaxID=2126344 RepID=A0A451A2K2_9GAMM|nr:MAG: cobalamin-5'-phosphate synthase [Candidatus Kentron sp. UNK]VFK68400.1 MAG: cobalamin-5'-phosphate synthase [Candidatus Kentron sp. UNK]